MPQDYAFVMEELITEKPEILDKEAYYETIIDTIIQTDRAESFIVAMSELIQRLAVEHLHILGDIYDRGPAPHKIMISCCNITLWIFSGAIMILYGWEQLPDSLPVSQRLSATLLDIATWTF